jgi:hypothetical protein
MPQNNERGRNDRETQVKIDAAAETPSRVADATGGSLAGAQRNIGDAGGGDRQTGFPDRGGGELRIEDSSDPNSGTLPPPSAHRADTMVRGVGADARQAMERDATTHGEPSFTKGRNAPPVDQSRYPYTVEEMDEMLTKAPQGLFPDTPGGDGATPLSADRNSFLADMGDRGRFPSQKETERWARSVFNAFRHRALEVDDALILEFTSLVRVGEAPEVQVEEMMWGGDYLDRMMRLVSVLGTWTRQEFYEQVAEEAGETPDDPWVDAAIHSFLGTLKAYLGSDADGVRNLGELAPVWEKA